MVNVDLSPATYLGIVLIGSGLALLQIRQSKPLLSRDTDIISACVSILAGGILVFQGWRLDPILLFEQLLMASTAIAFGYEALRLRSQLPDSQAMDEGAATPEAMLGRSRRGLPPPARSDFSQWAGQGQGQQQRFDPQVDQQGVPYDPRQMAYGPPPLQQQQQQRGGQPGVVYGAETSGSQLWEGQVGPTRDAIIEAAYNAQDAAYGDYGDGPSPSGRRAPADGYNQGYYGDSAPYNDDSRWQQQQADVGPAGRQPDMTSPQEGMPMGAGYGSAAYEQPAEPRDLKPAAGDARSRSRQGSRRGGFTADDSLGVEDWE